VIHHLISLCPASADTPRASTPAITLWLSLSSRVGSWDSPVLGPTFQSVFCILCPCKSIIVSTPVQDQFHPDLAVISSSDSAAARLLLVQDVAPCGHASFGYFSNLDRRFQLCFDWHAIVLQPVGLA
jgi:hypothetical protein